MSEQYTPTTGEIDTAATTYIWDLEKNHPGTYEEAPEFSDYGAVCKAFRRWLDQVRREAKTVTQEQIATMSRSVARHAAGNLPGLPDDEFECCFRAALHEAGFIIEQEGKNDE